MSNATIPAALQATARSYNDDTLATAGVLQALTASAIEPARVDGHHHVILPPGYQRSDITDLVEKAQPAPNRKRGSVTLKDAKSLLAYCIDQGNDEGGYLYADPDSREIVAVFNDQRAGAGWRDHRAVYKAEFSKEFARWLEKDRQKLSQLDFGEFIEDNAADITEATKLLEVANTLQAKTDISFSSGQRLDNGQVQLTYTEVVNASAGVSGGLQIPREFQIGLRIFRNGAGYKLTARLKYRLGNGKVVFWYELDRPEKTIEDAFSDYVKQLRDGSGYIVLIGKP